MKPTEQAVVYIITKLELGGAQKVCLTLFNGLQEHQVKTFLISGTQGPLVQAVQGKPNVFLLESFKHAVALRGVIQEIQSFCTLVAQLRALKKQHPHIMVHTHSTKAGIVGRFAAFFAGIKTRIHTVHGYAFHDHQPRLVWYAIYAAELLASFITSHFVCVSSYDVELGKKLFPRFGKKHSIIRAAVAWDQFYRPARTLTEFPQQYEPFIFGTTACFKKQKNLFDLLRAFHAVHQRYAHTRLEIIGDGTLRKELEAWIAEHQLTDVVKLHGWQTNVAEHMMNWHAFTLSSLWEGLPCAIVEARLLKLPVIAYNTGGISDVIRSMHNGILIEQGKWQELAVAMQNVVDDKTLYQTLQTHEDELADFNDAAMIQHHYELYTTTLQRTGK